MGAQESQAVIIRQESRGTRALYTGLLLARSRPLRRERSRRMERERTARGSQARRRHRRPRQRLWEVSRDAVRALGLHSRIVEEPSRPERSRNI
jgi:hypothetical protein